LLSCYLCFNDSEALPKGNQRIFQPSY